MKLFSAVTYRRTRKIYMAINWSLYPKHFQLTFVLCNIRLLSNTNWCVGRTLQRHLSVITICSNLQVGYKCNVAIRCNHNLQGTYDFGRRDIEITVIKGQIMADLVFVQFSLDQLM